MIVPRCTTFLFFCGAGVIGGVAEFSTLNARDFIHEGKEFGGRVQFTGALNKYGLHGDVLNSDALGRIRLINGTALLPQAYAEGCPIHPAYPSGHATIAGACVTVLKAFFDGTVQIAAPVTPARSRPAPK